jgi:hypothetical protein
MIFDVEADVALTLVLSLPQEDSTVVRDTHHAVPKAQRIKDFGKIRSERDNLRGGLSKETTLPSASWTPAPNAAGAQKKEKRSITKKHVLLGIPAAIQIPLFLPFLPYRPMPKNKPPRSTAISTSSLVAPTQSPVIPRILFQ